jgi:hypothetical protein
LVYVVGVSVVVDAEVGTGQLDVEPVGAADAVAVEV